MQPHAATPVEVDALLERVFELPEGEWAEAIEELCATHPGAAPSLRRRYALLAESGMLTASPRPEFLSPGQRFGRYRLVELLGAGGMGVVFRARADGASDDVALKVLRPDLLVHPTAQARFLREAAALADVAHPAICALVDFGEHAGVPFLAMKLLRGRTLAAAIAEARRQARPSLVAGDGGGPSWRTVVKLFAILARGLAVVHARGLVHRDLKPENIVVEHGAPVLIDFGLAATPDATRLTRSGEPLGTPAYMAPEQVRGGGVDARTDVYGLAASLYESVALRPPFPVAGREALYRAILVDEAPDVRAADPSLPRALALVLQKGLQKAPAARYATALALAEDLERVAADDPVHARPVPIWRRTWRVARARPRSAVAAIAVAVLVGLGGHLWQVGQRSARIVSEGLAMSSAALLQRDVTVGALVAREAHRQLPDSEATRSNLVRALSQNLQVAEFDVGRLVSGYVPAPDGGVALVLTDRVWLREGERIRAVPGTAFEGATWQQFHSAAWARDGQSCLLAVSGAPRSDPPREGLLVRLSRDGARLPLDEAVFPGSANLSQVGLGAGVQVVAGLDQGAFVVGDVGGGLRAIDAQGTTVAKWASPSAPEPIVFVGALADGRAFVTVDFGGSVRLWDGPGGGSRVLFDTASQITAACATADCERLALGDLDGKVHILAPRVGPHLASVDFGVAKPIEALALAPDGTAVFAAAVGQRFGLWQLGAAVEGCVPRLVVQGRAPQLVRSAAFSPDGACIALTGIGTRLDVIDRQGRALLDLVVAHEAPMLVRFTAPKRFVTAGWDQRVREWQLDAPGFVALRAHDYPALNLAWLPDGRSLVSAGADGRVVWTGVDGTRFDEFTDPGGQTLLFAMALSPDGTELVAGSNRQGQLLRLRLDHTARRFIPLTTELAPGRWQSVAWCFDGSVRLGTLAGAILAHDFDSGATSEWRRGDGTRAHSWEVRLDVARDGRVAAVSPDGAVSLWRQDGEHERTLFGEDRSAQLATFGPDGDCVLVGRTGGRLHVVDRGGNVVRRFEGCIAEVVDARCSPDGSFVAAVCSDSQLLVWRAHGDGRPWLHVPLPGELLGHRLAFSPDGEQVAIACSDGAIHVVPVSERRIVESANTIFRDLSPGERATLVRRR